MTAVVSNPRGAWPFRYEMMDGLRGIAALIVVMHHLLIVSGGHYAVMMFFVISGYCIAASTESCRRNGVSFGAFMRRRLHRIYPPYFFAIVFYFLNRLAKVALGRDNDLHRPLLDWIQNLTMTQWVSLLFEPQAEAARNPKLLVAAFWSLNYEEQFYLVMGLALLLAAYRRVTIPTVVIGLAIAGFMWNCLWPGGWVTGLFIEYWVHFALGATLFYVLSLHADRAARTAFLGFAVALLLLCACKIFPWEADTFLHNRVFAELGAAGAFALLLFFLRPYSAAISRHWLWKPIAALGVISYSLYLVHQFNLVVATALVDRMAPGAWQPARSALTVAVEIAIGAVFWYLCERPFLNRSPLRPSPAAGEHVEELARVSERIPAGESAAHRL